MPPKKLPRRHKTCLSRHRRRSKAQLKSAAQPKQASVVGDDIASVSASIELLKKTADGKSSANTFLSSSMSSANSDTIVVEHNGIEHHLSRDEFEQLLAKAVVHHQQTKEGQLSALEISCPIKTTIENDTTTIENDTTTTINDDGNETLITIDDQVETPPTTAVATNPVTPATIQKNTTTVNYDPKAFDYYYNLQGEKIQRNSTTNSRQALFRGVKKIRDAIFASGQDDSQRAPALHQALRHRTMLPISHAAGLSPSELARNFPAQYNPVQKYHMEQLKEMIQLSSGEKGKTNKDCTLVRDALITSVVPSPNSYIHNTAAPSMRESIENLGLSYNYRTRKIFTRAMAKRRELKVSRAQTLNPKWLSLLKRNWKGHRQITPQLTEKVISWIRNHQHVVQSPIQSDTIIKTDSQGTKTRVPKLLLEIPVRELHNNLVETVPEVRSEQGKLLVSDTSLRMLIKKTFRNSDACRHATR